MKLKKIELQGFKSFADKTQIDFLDGVTTIVGPNGSGKSNISDALRWVLGEQSVKTLRGSKMEDVIFAGTQARKKVGFAEVSMYIDNSDMALPVEYKEVVVTRRVYRTGESNYLINNNECRLKDIQELFMDTGVGKDGYSIISQGKIDEILSTKSDDRRSIFEEASGIVKYRTRKEEASRKLNSTEATLTRVSDVLTEIENVIGPLEQKAGKAKKYLKLRDELKNFDVKLFIDSVESNNKDLAKLDEIISTFENDIENEEKDYANLGDKKESIKDRIQELSLKIEETQSKFFDLQNEVERINSKIEVNNTQISNDTSNISRLENEIVEDKEKITSLKEELEKRNKKRITMSENKAKFEEDLAKKQEELNKILENLDSRGLEIEDIKNAIDINNEEKYDLKIKVSSIESSIESNEKQIEERKKQEEKNISQKDSISAMKDDIYLKLNSKTKELTKIEDEITEVENEKRVLNDGIIAIKDEDRSLNQELITLKSKYNYLVNLEKENEGYFKSVKDVLEYSKENPYVYGTIASLISTDEKYEYAIEISLGGYIQNIVVETEKEAKEMIAYLKNNSLGRATFLPLNTIKEIKFDLRNKVAKLPGFIAMANELVNFDSKYKKAINLALGTTVIVDNIDNAVAMSKAMKNSIKIVTLSGEMIATTGSMTGGKTKAKSAGLIGRSEKINQLQKEVENKQAQVESFSKKVEESNKKLNEIDKKITGLLRIKQDKSIEVATLKEKYSNIQKDFERIENSKENAKKIIEDLEIANNQFKEQISEYNSRIDEIEIENASKQEIVDEYARFNKEKQQEIDFLNEDVVNLKISLSSFDESVASIDEMKEKIEQDVKNFEFGIDRKVEQIELLKENINNCNKDIESLKESIKKQHEFKEQHQVISEKLKKEKEELAKNQEEIDKKLIDSVKKVERIKEEKAKVESKKVKFDVELENLKNKMWDDYELTVSSAKKLLENITFEDLDEKQISKNAEKIRKEIKELGEVDVGSIEEYKNTKERYDFISNQKNDLEETKQKLNNLISNMTSIMKNQFSKQFKVIAKNFNETFQELFGGGKADLTLSDESNILESGIEIEVQPPGKKLQSMMLLSGGEKALTAVALLFAILKIKTPPFCILDEIEAALDDVNVHRYAEYIKNYSKDTQFIVITHRKGTMEVASSVYGVTMQEYGISKVVSMKLK